MKERLQKNESVLIILLSKKLNQVTNKIQKTSSKTKTDCVKILDKARFCLL